MGRWSELLIESRSPRYCFSSEEYKEAKYGSYYNDDIEEKLIPDWFYLNLSYCFECKGYKEFVKNYCSSHKGCFICGKRIYFWLDSIPSVCSRVCELKYKNISCFDCQNIIFNKSSSRRCLRCRD